MTIQDKVALVTGAAQGIGKCIAETLAKSGSTVILNDINELELEKTINDFRLQNLKVYGHRADVSRDEDVKLMINHIVDKHSKIDILINNAAISVKNQDNTKKFTLDIPVEEWDQVLATNLRSVFLCSKYSAKYMIKNKYGKIVNMTSILGKVGCAADKHDNFHPISSTSASHYCSSKAGIIGFTRSLARELAKFGITVNAIAPGAVSGGMGKFGGDVVERMKTQIPMGELATQQDIANGILFLCSDQSKYITGETLNINGGWLMD